MKQINSENEWNEFVKGCGGHPLQLWGWGSVKERHGWKAVRYLSDDKKWGAQVLIRPLPFPAKAFAYVPRGPVGEWGEVELGQLSAIVRRSHRPIALSIEPHIREADIQLDRWKGWRKAKSTVLISETLVLDLTTPEDELFADIAKKTRQYIRKSLNNLEVRRVDTKKERVKCFEVYRRTAERAGFRIHGEDYYEDIAELLGAESVIYGAYENNDLVAFVWLAVTSAYAFELYGGITDRGQALKANYGLKWEAIRQTQKAGTKQYDMNGLLNDGISTFKRSFASHETTLVGTYDKPLSVWYPVWTYGLPLAKKIIRTLQR